MIDMDNVAIGVAVLAMVILLIYTLLAVIREYEMNVDLKKYFYRYKVMNCISKNKKSRIFLNLFGEKMC
jgi:hypothetical protein